MNRGRGTTFRCAGSTALLAAIALLTPAASHAIDAATRCEADKHRAVGRYLACRHNAIGKAIKRDRSPDFSRCLSTFERKMAAVERRRGAACPTVGDASSLAAMLAQVTGATAGLLEGPPGPGLLFAGYRWVVKQPDTPVGPGPNRFSDRPGDVWVDKDGLHLSISFHDGSWWSTEVILDENLGYGTYVFHTESRIDVLDANIVLGMFTWDDAAPPNYREIDFEYARWGNPSEPTNAQYVVQPYGTAGNLERFRVDLTPGDQKLTHVLVWSAGQVEMATYRGHHLADALPAFERIHAWINDGPDVPVPGAENVRMNLWLNFGSPPLDGLPEEVVVTNFLFTP